MATFTSIFIPGQNTGGVSTLAAPYTATLAASGTSSEIPIGFNQLFAINATADINIRFGPTGTVAASASDFRIPGGVVATFDMGKSWQSICLFSTPGATYWVMKMSRV